MLIKPNGCSKLATTAASTNGTLAKNGPGYIFTIIASNTTASVKYLKLYNKASAPVVGTDVPFMTIALGVSNLPTILNIASGLYLNTGIAYAITGAAADTDATALTAGDVVGVNILFN